MNTSRLVVMAMAAASGAILVVLRDSLLPERFNRDSLQIQGIASGRVSALGDDSFAHVAAVYRALGLEDAPVAAGLLGYLLALAVLGIVVAQSRGRLSWLAATTVVIAIGLSAVYLGTYSKDVFVLPVVALVLCLRRGLLGEILVLVALVAYAELFRTYWFLVAGLFLTFRLLVWSTRRRWVLVTAIPIALLALAVLMPLVMGQPSDYGRTSVNDIRAGVDVSTRIEPFVSLPGPIGSFINTGGVLVTAIVPVPLLLHGVAYYLVASAVILVTWGALFVGARAVHRESRAMRGLVFIAAFVTTQALFEPDYGSLLRHLTPVLPLLCWGAIASAGLIGRHEEPWPVLRLHRKAASVRPRALTVPNSITMYRTGMVGGRHETRGAVSTKS